MGLEPILRSLSAHVCTALHWSPMFSCDQAPDGIVGFDGSHNPVVSQPWEVAAEADGRHSPTHCVLRLHLPRRGPGHSRSGADSHRLELWSTTRATGYIIFPDHYPPPSRVRRETPYEARRRAFSHRRHRDKRHRFPGGRSWIRSRFLSGIVSSLGPFPSGNTPRMARQRDWLRRYPSLVRRPDSNRTSPLRGATAPSRPHCAARTSSRSGSQAPWRCSVSAFTRHVDDCFMTSQQGVPGSPRPLCADIPRASPGLEPGTATPPSRFAVQPLNYDAHAGDQSTCS